MSKTENSLMLGKDKDFQVYGFEMGILIDESSYLHQLKYDETLGASFFYKKMDANGYNMPDHFIVTEFSPDKNNTEKHGLIMHGFYIVPHTGIADAHNYIGDKEPSLSEDISKQFNDLSSQLGFKIVTLRTEYSSVVKLCEYLSMEWVWMNSWSKKFIQPQIDEISHIMNSLNTKYISTSVLNMSREEIHMNDIYLPPFAWDILRQAATTSKPAITELDGISLPWFTHYSMCEPNEISRAFTINIAKALSYTHWVIADICHEIKINTSKLLTNQDDVDLVISQIRSIIGSLRGTVIMINFGDAYGKWHRMSNIAERICDEVIPRAVNNVFVIRSNHNGDTFVSSERTAFPAYPIKHYIIPDVLPALIDKVPELMVRFNIPYSHYKLLVSSIREDNAGFIDNMYKLSEFMVYYYIEHVMESDGTRYAGSFAGPFKHIIQNGRNHLDSYDDSRFATKVDEDSENQDESSNRNGRCYIHTICDLFEDAFRGTRPNGPSSFKAPSFNPSTDAITGNSPKHVMTLDDIIGLGNVKEIVRKIVNHYTMLDVYKANDIHVESINKHMVFTGNPGTGKTTVARLITKMLADNHVIQKNKLIEVGRGDIVGKYVGHTAQKVTEAFNNASGGVLFIDEAYSLATDADSGYGSEAISTIVMEMENRRNDVIVIFAGYKDEMEDMLNVNPGMKSRIAFHVDFPDYNPNEMLEICESLVSRNDMCLTTLATEKLKKYLIDLGDFSKVGNGRFARNVIEQSLVSHSTRLFDQRESAEKVDMMALSELDIQDGWKTAIENTSGKGHKKRVGF